MKKREVRTFQTTEMRVVRADGEAAKIVGHAAMFDSPTQIGSKSWGWMETVKAGAFANSIKVDDVRALFNHDPNIVLGRNVAGTLELSEDDRGLLYEITPPETQWARDLLESIDRGDVSGSSFGFEVVEQVWRMREDDDEMDERDLIELRLWDVSPVTFPAYDDTDVSVKSEDDDDAGSRAYKEFREKAKQAETREASPEDDAEPAPENREEPEVPEEKKTNTSKMRMKLRLRS